MPESFDTLLAEIAENAGIAVHPVGPAAARQRGHQRAVRRRFVVSVLSVVLLGGVSGVVLALSSNHAGAPAPITHTGTSAPTTPSTPGSPSASSGTWSPSASASASVSAPPPAVTGDLHRILPAAWIPVSKFPFAGLGWTANTSQPAIHTSDRQWFTSCVGGTLAHLGTYGYQEVTYRPSLASDPDSADQMMFFFESDNLAAQALATVQNDYANCTERTTGVDGKAITGTLRQTEELDGSYAWLNTYRTANGAAGQPADIASDNHEYVVQRGDVLELIWFGSSQAVDNQSSDLQFLNDLNASLCVYGGKCPAAASPVTVSIGSLTGTTSLALGGRALDVGVTVTNNSDDTLHKIAPIVSLGHCTCVNTSVPTMPKGLLQVLDPLGGGSWQTVFYNTEGSGMDYVLSFAAGIQVPMFDLPPGDSLSFSYRVGLDPLGQQTKLTAPFRYTNGTSSIDVTLVHPGTSSVPNVQIGTSPSAELPVTVTVN